MTDIYEQHSKAFRQVSAFVILKDGKQVGSVALKYPRDGAGRLWAYVHYHGTPMVRGYAGGYGYDKTSAAVEAAVTRIEPRDPKRFHFTESEQEALTEFKAIIAADHGHRWDQRLRAAGFEVLQAV